MKKSQLFKRFLCTALCVLLALNGFTAFAVEDSAEISGEVGTELTAEVVAAKLDSITSDLSEAVALEDYQVEALVEYQINTYMMTELEAEGQDIIPGETETWIDLHDLEGNCFAHIVPLTNNYGEEIGFIVIGGIEDGFTHYMMGWDTSILKAYRELQNVEPSSVPVFFPPMEFGYKMGEGLDRKVYALSMGDYLFYDVTTAVAENAEAFARSYQMIRDAKNAENMELALFNAQQIEQGYEPVASVKDIAIAAHSDEQAASVARVAVEDVRLECEKKGTDQFVAIPDGNGTKPSYGCSQSWLTSPYDSSRACGVAAACNILCYMAYSNPSKYASLFPYTPLNKKNFLYYMQHMYTVQNPGWDGNPDIERWSANIITDGIITYRVTLTEKLCGAKESQATCATHIKNGLRLDKPVGALNLSHSYYETVDNTSVKFGWHWVTITKYFQSSGDNRWIAVSSWGRRYSLNWDAYYSYGSTSLVSGGYIYFQ